MKWIVRIVLAVVVLVAVVGVVAFWQMDRIATVGLQKAMAFATQCDVEVEKVDLSPFAGEAGLDGLDIKNPEDFREIQDSFVIMKAGSAGVDLGSLRSDLVEVPELTIDGVEISLVGRDGKTNYETILESLARLQGEDAPKEEGEAESGKEFVIRKVTITNVQVWVDMDEDPALGLAPVKFDKPLTLKPIVLTDVGAGGLPLSQISADLIADILVQVVAQLGNQLGDRVLSGLTSGLTGVLGGADELQAQLTSITGDLGLDNVDVGAQLDKASELGSAVFEGLGDGAGGAVDLGRDLLGGGSEDGEEEEESEDGGGGLLDRF